jgi:hypothetical protein
VPFPNDLLEQARHLANREPKRPKQASLRRAVSTAYYAIFHLLSIKTARNWKRSAERPTLARMLDHAPMAKVCTARLDELAKYFKTRPPASRKLDVLKHLYLIAETFALMLQHRHTADCDSSAKWSRTDVLEKIGSVEAAFQSWQRIRTQDEAQHFLATLMLRGRRN